MLRPLPCAVAILLLGYITGTLCDNHQIKYDHGFDVATKRPLIIGHRGSSGVLPEHTRRAYEQAIEDGADMIECDVVVTSDAVLVCRHDPWLSTSTDIADHAQFADRKHTIVDFEYYGSVKNITDWFIKDFTFAELETLRVYQTNSERNQGYNGQYQIISLDDYIDIAKKGNVAINIELKYPKWTNSLGLFETTFEEAFIDQLAKHGYTKPTDPCILQTFEFESNKVLANLTDLPLMMAIEYEHQATDDLLREYAAISYGVITWKCSVADHYGPTGGYKNWIRNFTDVVQRIHEHGMKAHLYTFRNEQSNLAWDYAQDPWREYDAFTALGVHGYFTDFPATFKRYLDVLYREEQTCGPVNSALAVRRGSWTGALTGLLMTGIVVTVI